MSKEFQKHGSLLLCSILCVVFLATRRIRRITLKFLEDQSYLQLKQALENKNNEDAFRGAHTLKGVCQNLSFDRLYEASNELTELLRDRIGEKPGIPEAMEKVTEVYEMTIEEIKYQSINN